MSNLPFFVLTTFGSIFSVSQYLFYTLRNKPSSSFITSVCKALNYFLFLFVVFLFQKSWFIWLTNNTVRFFYKHFICYFYFLGSKIMSKAFLCQTIRCSNLFPIFYWFYFRLCVFHCLLFGKTFFDNLYTLIFYFVF